VMDLVLVSSCWWGSLRCGVIVLNVRADTIVHRLYIMQSVTAPLE
jgi:uncharacterized membrane protein